MSSARRRAKAVKRRGWIDELTERWDWRLGRIPRNAIAVSICSCGSRSWLLKGATDEDWERFREDQDMHDFCFEDVA